MGRKKVKVRKTVRKREEVIESQGERKIKRQSGIYRDRGREKYKERQNERGR